MPTDFEGLKDKINRSGAGWKPQSGDNRIRLLPPTPRWFEESLAEISYQFRTHFVRLEGRDLAVFR